MHPSSPELAVAQLHVALAVICGTTGREKAQARSDLARLAATVFPDESWVAAGLWEKAGVDLTFDGHLYVARRLETKWLPTQSSLADTLQALSTPVVRAATQAGVPIVHIRTHQNEDDAAALLGPTTAARMRVILDERQANYFQAIAATRMRLRPGMSQQPGEGAQLGPWGPAQLWQGSRHGVLGRTQLSTALQRYATVAARGR